MTTRELDDIVDGITDAVSAHLNKRLAELAVRIVALEQRAPLNGRDGLPGVPGSTGERGPQGEKGERGTDGSQGSQGLPGKDGLDGKDGRDGIDGKDGINGKDGLDGTDGKDGSPGEKGDPGMGIAGASIGPDGELILTYTDGTSKAVGRVVGKPGEPGEPGPVGPIGPRGERGEKGIDGKDGKNGVTLSPHDFVRFDIDADERKARLTFKRGDDEALITGKVTGLVGYRDVWSEDQKYEKGDVVTWGGSSWIALRDTSAKPGLHTEDSRAWKLMVKKGADGRVGAPGPAGPKGDKGDKGDRGPDRW